MNSSISATATSGKNNTQKNSSNGSSQNSSPQKPGLGRRSATQLELSRRKRNEDVEPTIQKTKWHSQEHLDKVSKVFFEPNKRYFLCSATDLELKMFETEKDHSS